MEFTKRSCIISLKHSQVPFVNIVLGLLHNDVVDHCPISHTISDVHTNTFLQRNQTPCVYFFCVCLSRLGGKRV